MQPDGLLRTIVWCLQALAVATVASHVVSLAASKLTPLTALFKMTLVFPDNAPSRFGVALRAGTIGRLRKKELDAQGSLQTAAVRAVELVIALGAHERSTRGHVERVRAYADLIGQELGLDADQLNKLRWGVLLHDIGKLQVPAAILSKKDALTESEWETLQTHPAAGGTLLEPLRPWLGEWVSAAAQHHERWDGTGYPAGLSGEDISLAARITSVADAVDVITSKRAYKAAQPIEEARRELVACSGTQFDPQIVRAFLQVGLQDPRRFGVFSWLLELPPFIRLASNMTAATAVVTVAASSLAPLPVTTLAMVESAPTMAGAVAHTPDWVEPVVTTPAEPESVGGLDDEAADPGQPGPPPVDSTVALDPTHDAQGSDLPQADPPPVTTPQAELAPTTVPPPVTAPPTTAVPQTTTAPTTTAAPTAAAPTTDAPATDEQITQAAAPPPPGPTGSGFVFLTADQLPPSLAEEGQLTSEAHVFLFQERTQMLLAESVKVQSFDQGETIDGDSTATTQLAAGTSICVWFVHIDASSYVFIDATIDFGQPILGYALRKGRLIATNQFELPNLNYGQRGSGTPDLVTTTGGQMVIRSEQWSGDIDHMRVFTSC